MAPRALKRRKVDDGEKFKEPTSVDDSKNIQQNTRDQPEPTKPNFRKKMSAAALSEAYTSETYRSSMFKLQVDELLGQVRLKYGSKEAPVEKSLRSLKQIIEEIPAQEPLPIAEAEREIFLSNKITIPFPYPLPPKTAKYKLEYRKPSYINAIGSYPLKIASKADAEYGVDLMITMPTELFQEKDYLNYRYFYKRSFYIARIAAGIHAAVGDKYRLEFDYLNGNNLQPILVVRPKGNASEGDYSSSKYFIQIIPALPEGTFPTEKLLPHKNNVRSEVLGDTKKSTEVNSTPLYNASIQMDSSMISYLKLMHGAASQSDSYRDACLLGRIWLRQRGLSSSVSGGGFGNFEWSALVALLLQANGRNGFPVASPGYSSYQLFKATLQFLATKDFLKTPQSFHPVNAEVKATGNSPILFDGPRGHNLLHKMTPWSYNSLKFEVRSTILALSDDLFDQFDSTFIVKVDQSPLRYDHTMELPTSVILQNETQNDQEKLLQNVQGVHNLILKGLGDRITLVNIALPKDESWEIRASRPSKSSRKTLNIGLIIDPANAQRLVDRGPSAEDKNAASLFREFWGEKADLRRFNDGSIRESVVWSSEKDLIIQQIIKYLLGKHVGAEASRSIHFHGIEAAGYLSSSQVESNTAQFQPLMKSFTDLERDLRGLENLPLALRHVFAADPALRYGSIIPPLTAPQCAMALPANVIIQFEGSGRWPDDLEAIQRTKVAFLLKLGELLTESIPGISARVGLENEYHSFMNCSFLDVLYPSGAAFRIRIHHDREETLLDRQLKDKSIAGPEREKIGNALKAYQREFIHKPSHTQTLQTLCTRFPILSPTIRLTKKWFNSHLLACHVSHEVIELLVIRTFVQPYPWRAPSSPVVGFLRTLYFLSRWDWRSQPLIVNCNGAMTSTDLENLTTRFEAWRKIDPAFSRVVLFVTSNTDAEGTIWTDHGRPAVVVAARMTALAKAAYNEIKATNSNSSFAGLFTSPLVDFDFVLHLNAASAEDEHRTPKTKSQFKNLQVQDVTVNSANPVQEHPGCAFVAEIEQLYGHAFVLFHGIDSPHIIAGVWNPSLERRPWRVRLGYSSEPAVSSDTEQVVAVMNHDAILAEIARIGGDLIHKIDIQKH